MKRKATPKQGREDPVSNESEGGESPDNSNQEDSKSRSSSDQDLESKLESEVIFPSHFRGSTSKAAYED